MTSVLLFHHAGGLTPGVLAFADTLRGAGHDVHTPDVFDGHTFADVADGIAYAESLGRDALADRAADAADGLPTDLVYAGCSLGIALAAGTLLQRPGGRGACFLYGVVDPAWWGTEWPEHVPVQAHVTADDPWREPDAEAAFVRIRGAELFVYPGAGHLFAEAGHPDHDLSAAGLATHRVLEFLDRL